jgi:hypothetical protein
MQAFHNIRTEMRETCIDVSSPLRSAAGRPARVSHPRATGHDSTAQDTHIEPWMEIAFHGLTHASETGEPFGLVPCFMNGEPAALIAAMHREGGRTHVLPLFMAVQPWMSFTGPDGEGGGDDGEEGGGPARNTADTPAPR